VYFPKISNHTQFQDASLTVQVLFPPHNFVHTTNCFSISFCTTNIYSWTGGYSNTHGSL